MDNPIVLTFDCGTQSIRALLVDKKGNILAKEQEQFTPYYSLEPGYAEQKPEIYWNALVKVSKNIHLNNKKLVDKIIAVTITTIRDTFVCLDKQGKPLRDIIHWLDQREAKCEEPLPVKSSLAFSIVGLKEALEDQRKISKSNWLRENEPEIWKKTDKFILYSGYMVYRLTGKIVDSIASQVAHLPFDYKNKKWHSPTSIMYPVFNVEKEKLSDLIEPGEIFGYIGKKIAEETLIKEGLPLIATGSDKGCETLGCGVLNNDMASLSFGTSATVQVSTIDYVEPDKMLPAYPGVVSGTYNPEVQVFRGYWMVSWFKKEFAEKEVLKANELGVSPEIVLNETLKDIPAGSEGLMLQPYWSPLLKLPEAKGSIIGFSSEHTRAHVYKAIIEGIGYGLVEGLRRLEKNMGRKIKCLTVSGGGSQSDEICQITADMFGIPVRRIQTYEACGLGSSMVAFVSMGVFKDYKEAIENMVHYKTEFTPNKQVHEIYDELYSDIYKNIYHYLRPLYKKMRQITKRKGASKDVK
ncbi:MAG: FGGY-family carbohydrate kinase [Bacilli bacterium]